MKCLTLAPTPDRCSEATKAPASRPVSSGSSEKHSKWRPPTGVRWRLTTGASTTSTPLRAASFAMTVPSSSSSSRSQVAAVPDGDGSWAEVERSSSVPRTPMGPSERTTERRPMDGSSVSFHVVAPVRSEIRSSRDRAATNGPNALSRRPCSAGASVLTPILHFKPRLRGVAMLTHLLTSK